MFGLFSFQFFVPPKTHKQTNISHHGRNVSLSPIFPPGSLSPLRFPPKNHFKTPPTQKKESCPWRFTGNDTGPPGDFHLPGANFLLKCLFFSTKSFWIRFWDDFGSVWDEGFYDRLFFCWLTPKGAHKEIATQQHQPLRFPSVAIKKWLVTGIGWWWCRISYWAIFFWTSAEVSSNSG